MEQASIWLTLHRAPKLGARSLLDLVEHFGSPLSAVNANPQQLRQYGLSQETLDWLANPDQQRLDQDLAWLAQEANQILSIEDPNYPPLLKELPDPPPLLFLTGDPDLLQLPQLALVGSRNPTTGGTKNARDFAQYLAERGLIISSGLARGIDGAAHQGALAGKGKTIAVMGTGNDRIYPAQHHQLAHEIVTQGGLLVSELPLGSPPLAGNFPRRNRILTGLSLGVLVVEATLKSGSLISARLANEQGREVFAIPGSIHNIQARGCHALIKQGAKLVETAQDILEELLPLLGLLADAAQPETETPPVPTEHQPLLEAMGFDPISVDELAQLIPLPAGEINAKLLLLELEGHVSSSPGGLYCRTH